MNIDNLIKVREFVLDAPYYEDHTIESIKEKFNLSVEETAHIMNALTTEGSVHFIEYPSKSYYKKDAKTSLKRLLKKELRDPKNQDYIGLILERLKDMDA